MRSLGDETEVRGVAADALMLIDNESCLGQATEMDNE